MVSTTSNKQEVNIPEIVESITGLIFAPVILPVTAAVKQPTFQEAIKVGIALSERCKEAIAETGEIIENLSAEVNTELIERKQGQPYHKTVSQTTPIGETGYQNGLENGTSEVAKDLIHVVADVNGDIGRITNGVIDLRLLLPLGLGALAIRQLIVKGIDIDEIPWYTLTWYAFDSFIKLNNQQES
jgi:hypothetical protein